MASVQRLVDGEGEVEHLLEVQIFRQQGLTLEESEVLRRSSASSSFEHRRQMMGDAGLDWSPEKGSVHIKVRAWNTAVIV